MKNNKHRDDSRPSMLVTKSKRYWAGSKRNKPKHGTSTKDKGLCVWENNLDMKADRLVEQLSIYKNMFSEYMFRRGFEESFSKYRTETLVSYPEWDAELSLAMVKEFGKAY